VLIAPFWNLARIGHRRTTTTFQGDNDVCHAVSSCKAKKLVNTFLVDGFQSVKYAA